METHVYLLYHVYSSTYSYDGTDNELVCIFKDMPTVDRLIGVGVPIQEAEQLAGMVDTKHYFIERVEVI